MSHIVLLRAANVGGRNVLKPRELAQAIDGFDVTSIGAAGTFAVRGTGDEGELRRAFEAALPVDVGLVVLPADGVLALVDRDPFASLDEGEKGYVTLLAAEPDDLPQLPLDRPEDGTWQLRVVEADPPVVLTVRRTEVPGRFYPNEVVEKAFGVPATTRGWTTVLRVAKALAATPGR